MCCGALALAPCWVLACDVWAIYAPSLSYAFRPLYITSLSPQTPQRPLTTNSSRPSPRSVVAAGGAVVPNSSRPSHHQKSRTSSPSCSGSYPGPNVASSHPRHPRHPRRSSPGSGGGPRSVWGGTGRWRSWRNTNTTRRKKKKGCSVGWCSREVGSSKRIGAGRGMGMLACLAKYRGVSDPP